MPQAAKSPLPPLVPSVLSHSGSDAVLPGAHHVLVENALAGFPHSDTGPSSLDALGVYGCWDAGGPLTEIQKEKRNFHYAILKISIDAHINKLTWQHKEVFVRKYAKRSRKEERQKGGKVCPLRDETRWGGAIRGRVGRLLFSVALS